ncbi:MAG: hypothetical protein ABIU05_28055 [Nitrospirales bacterium]
MLRETMDKAKGIMERVDSMTDPAALSPTPRPNPNWAQEFRAEEARRQGEGQRETERQQAAEQRQRAERPNG